MADQQSSAHGVPSVDSAAAMDEEALDRLLDAEPRSLPALVGKAAYRARAGDDEAARLLYARAVRVADHLPAADRPDGLVDEARAALRGLQEKAHARREKVLSDRGVERRRWSGRFAEALDIAAGRRALFRQEPTAFFYPGLATVPFFDRADFGWVAEIEAAVPGICEELLALLGGEDHPFRAYITSDRGSGPLGDNRALLHNRDWSILALCENGWLTPEMIRRCPRTWEAVLKAPLPRIAGWGPTVVFSMLKAGARIAPHSGMYNTRLLCHLPLIVPPGCAFRVGNQVREWEVGKLMIFDDSIEHEAWNESDEDRVILIFDVWRPELDERERHELTALFSD